MATKRKSLVYAASVAVAALLVPALAVSGGFDAKRGYYRDRHIPGASRGFVSFQVTRSHKVKNPEFRLMLNGGCQERFGPTDPVKISPDGKFRMAGPHAWIKGRFVSNSRAKGKVHGETADCGSGTARYVADWRRLHFRDPG